METTLLFVPPNPLTAQQIKKRDQALGLKKKGAPVEEHLFYRDEDGSLNLAAPNLEGVYEYIADITYDETLSSLCPDISKLEVYIFDVFTLTDDDTDYYFYQYAGKMVSGKPPSHCVRTFGFSNFLTKVISAYYVEKEKNT